jgi:NADH dehydrogenase [ubiquinone] 1 alpha subcomplex assembly factor 1
MNLLSAFLASAALSSFELQANNTTWYVINDGVMGGVSSSTAKIVAGNLEFAGRVRLENNGGFASIRTNSGQYNLGSFSSLTLRVRGDGKKYGFQIGTNTARGILYRFEFETRAEQWTEINVPFKNLQATRFGQVLPRPAFNSSNIEHFGFIIGNKKAEDFKLELDWIRAQ